MFCLLQWEKGRYFSGRRIDNSCLVVSIYDNLYGKRKLNPKSVTDVTVLKNTNYKPKILRTDKTYEK